MRDLERRTGIGGEGARGGGGGGRVDKNRDQRIMPSGEAHRLQRLVRPTLVLGYHRPDRCASVLCRADPAEDSVWVSCLAGGRRGPRIRNDRICFVLFSGA